MPLALAVRHCASAHWQARRQCQPECHWQCQLESRCGGNFKLNFKFKFNIWPGGPPGVSHWHYRLGVT